MKVIKINMDAGVNKVMVNVLPLSTYAEVTFPQAYFLISAVELRHLTLPLLNIESCHSMSLAPAYAKATVKAEEGRPQWFRCSEDLVWYN